MRYLSYALCFLGGLFYALGFPSFIAESLFITPIIGAGLFLFFLDKETKLKKQFLLFLSFALGQTLMGYYWIPKTLIVFGEIPVPIAYFLGIFFAVIVFPNFMVYTLLKNQIENRIKPLGSFYGFNFPIIF
jgi:apolipoprotein N-acyltransferase